MVQATDGGNTSDSPDEEDYTGNEIYLLHIIYQKAWSMCFLKFIMYTYGMFNFHINQFSNIPFFKISDAEMGSPIPPHGIPRDWEWISFKSGFFFEKRKIFRINEKKWSFFLSNTGIPTIRIPQTFFKLISIDLHKVERFLVLKTESIEKVAWFGGSFLYLVHVFIESS